MAYDPSRPLLDQAIPMVWNNTYDQQPTDTSDADKEIQDRMHKLLETSPGVFKAFCATMGIDHEPYFTEPQGIEDKTSE